MRIELITVWYNEEYLAPFFLSHYSWVDKIHILLDADTRDNTENVARGYSNVEIDYFKFPDMMDDLIKARKINEKYRSITNADYVVVVDSDEFILCNTLEDPVREHIIEKGKNIYFSTLWQIYQHEDDRMLDAGKPVHLQRRHGDPAIESCYIKPVIAKSGLDVVWGYGNHSVVYDGKHMSWNTPNTDMMDAYGVSVRPADMLQGAHWRLFDLNETFIRRVRNRTNRQSRLNIVLELTYHHHNTTHDDILEEYNRTKKNPVVIKNRKCLDISKRTYDTIFEGLLAEGSFAEDYSINNYAEGIGHLIAACDLPDWYEHVIPQSASGGLADELFLLACEYHKKGNCYKAITVLQKALSLSPDNLHYEFYLVEWHKQMRVEA